jgi:hypothetical protein
VRFGDLDRNAHRRSDGDRAFYDERESGFDCEREAALAYERGPELE